MSNSVGEHGRTTARRFLSRLKAEIDVEEFEQTRERLRERHRDAERRRLRNKLQRNQMTGVIDIDSL